MLEHKSAHAKPTLHLLMPMSGQGRRFQEAGYNDPKPMIDVNGEAIIARLLTCFDAAWPTHFVLADNHMTTQLPQILQQLRPQARITSIAAHSLGPGHALQAALAHIPDDDAVLVSYCDYGMRWDKEAFVRFVDETKCDACLVSYRGFHAHYTSDTPYAYARMHGEQVVEVREKAHFTSNREDEYASTGTYYFRTAKLLRESLRYQREHAMTVNQELYTSLTVAALLSCQPNADVRVFEIDKFFQWGTPQDLEQFCFWEKSYRAMNAFTNAGRAMQVAQVLMPMAGLGSRFAQHTQIAKPLIPVAGEPMFRAALGSLPCAKKTVIVTLESIAQAVRHAGDAKATTVISLADTPAGQALSTEAGICALALDEPVVVSACDHGIVLNPQVWGQFSALPNCDAAIFTMTGFAAARHNPKAYAYVRCAPGDQSLFASVTEVSVKKPISERPDRDRVLVGTFWFRTARVLADAIANLKASPVYVNGELYLDSIFPQLLAEGQSVRAIALDGYLCWGDPDRLAEALYWRETFCGRGTTPRPRLPGVAKAV
jgi:NDP-sugar pyrophosphorylase family protein